MVFSLLGPSLSDIKDVEIWRVEQRLEGSRIMHWWCQPFVRIAQHRKTIARHYLGRLLVEGGRLRRGRVCQLSLPLFSLVSPFFPILLSLGPFGPLITPPILHFIRRSNWYETGLGTLICPYLGPYNYIY